MQKLSLVMVVTSVLLVGCTQTAQPAQQAVPTTDHNKVPAQMSAGQTIGVTILPPATQEQKITHSDAELKVGELSFAIPNGWTLKDTLAQGEVITVNFNVPDPKYHVVIPLSVQKTTDALPTGTTVLKTSDSGAKIYLNACAPVLSCYYVDFKGSRYDVRFEVAQSDEVPADGNYEGPWYPSTTVTEDDMLNFVTTVK